MFDVVNDKTNLAGGPVMSVARMRRKDFLRSAQDKDRGELNKNLLSNISVGCSYDKIS